VQAKPLRELGFGGVLGTVVAFVCAYVMYPPFLRWAVPRESKIVEANRRTGFGHAGSDGFQSASFSSVSGSDLASPSQYRSEPARLFQTAHGTARRD